MADRDRQIAAFLARQGWEDGERRTLADDASFRRYDRVAMNGETAVLMDAPPDKEDVRPFVAVTKILRTLGLSAPSLYAEDPCQGLLLLEDLGDDTYTRVLAGDPGQEDALYMLAVDLLIALHSRFEGAPGVPPYDDERLETEAALLLDWYLPAVTGEPVPDKERRRFLSLWRGLFAQARQVPHTLVLRDYHVDNLVWLPQRPGVAACGLLDYQDAVLGPVTYDLVSLLEDARRDVPAALADRALERYLRAFPDIDREAFRAAYAILGAQRSTKILGIFTRLDRRDGKPDYLCHLPRVWRWLEGDLALPALSGMRDWFDTTLPAGFRTIPEQMTRK